MDIKAVRIADRNQPPEPQVQEVFIGSELLAEVASSPKQMDLVT